ncbi:putative integral membrane protein [Acanthocheilonema viteae]
MQKLETIFPACHIIKKQFDCKTEKTGAWEEMDLRMERLPQRSVKQFRQNHPLLSVCQESYMHRLEINAHRVYQSAFGYCDRNRLLLQNSPITINEGQENQQQSYNNTYTSINQLNMLESKDSSLRNLIDIYKNSNNAVEFISNFEQYLSLCLPSYAWIGLMFLLVIWGLIHIIVGTINIPFCPLRPMIPLFLIVMGCLYIFWGLLRIYAFCPRSRADTLGIDLSCKALEILMIVTILVWLFLGSIWIYGPEQNINFERIYFRSHYCDSFTYWAAFISVTLHWVIILFTLSLLFCLFCVGLLKDDKQ